MVARLRGWPGAVLGVALALVVAVALDIPIVRPVLAFSFLLLCPGMAVVRLLRIPDRLVELVAGVSASLAMDTVVSLTLFYLRIWTWGRTLGVLIAICCLGVGLQVAGGFGAEPRRERRLHAATP